MGSIRKRGKGTWTIIYSLGRDPQTGKYRQKWETIKGTKAQAKAVLAEREAAVARGQMQDTSRMTVGQFLARWYDSHVTRIRPATATSYEIQIRCHITPAIGSILLSKLTPLDLQELYAAKLQGGRSDGKPGGLSPQSVRYIHAVIREALSDAVRWGMVSRNVADLIDPPRPDKQRPTAWTVEQATVFLQATRNDAVYPLYLLALMTGMRRGELLALEWQDIDWDRRTVSVQRSVQRVGRRLIVGVPKTEHSVRQVALPDSCIQALRHHRTHQLQIRLIMGGRYLDCHLVFPGPGGEHMEPRALTRRYERAIKRLPVPYIPFHGLRHTHATTLLKQGIHPKVVAERLGHSQIRTTMDTYSHVLPGMQEEAARAVERVLGEF